MDTFPGISGKNINRNPLDNNHEVRGGPGPSEKFSYSEGLESGFDLWPKLRFELGLGKGKPKPIDQGVGIVYFFHRHFCLFKISYRIDCGYPGGFLASRERVLETACVPLQGRGESDHRYWSSSWRCALSGLFSR